MSGFVPAAAEAADMPSIRSILLFGAPLASFAFAVPHPERDGFDTEVTAEWQEIVKELPGESLRAAMSSLKPKYREGVFEDGHDAITAIHGDDPDLASKVRTAEHLGHQPGLYPGAFSVLAL